jgi:hypothetical protein
MVYNNFILSFQLDPSMFNPFIDTNKVYIECINDEGDAYILATDDEVSPPSFMTSPENDEKSTPDTHFSEDDNSEPNDVTRICYRCQFCMQSGELSEGSDAYVCSRDGETLSSKQESRFQCFSFSERSDDSDEGDFQ